MQSSNIKIRIIIALSLSILCGSMVAAPVHARTLSLYEQALEDLDVEKYQEAELKLKKIIARNPNDAEAYAELGRAYMDMEDSARSVAASTRAIELDPKLVRAYANRSYGEFRQGRMQAGFTDSKKAIDLYEVNPLDWSIWNTYKNRAQAYKMMHRKDMSSAELKKSRIFELLDQAGKERENGRLDVARDKIDAAMRIDDQIADLWLLRGVVNSNLNKYPEAIADFTRANSLAPNVPMFFYFRGDCYQQLGKHQQAIDDFTKIINAKPKLVAYRFVCETGRLRNELMRDDTSPVSLADVYVLRAQSYSALKKLSLATKDLEKAGKLDPTDDKALAKNAELTMGAGKFDQAIDDYTKSVAANPKDWTRYKERADAYLQLGRNEEALIDYSEVVRLTPKEPGAYMLRALALKTLGKYDEAIPDFSKVLQLRSDDDDAYMERAECYRLMHRYKEALADLDKAAMLLPANNNFVREARAKIHAETGEDTSSRAKSSDLDKRRSAQPKAGYDNPNMFLILAAGLVLALLGIYVFLKNKKSK